MDDKERTADFIEQAIVNRDEIRGGVWTDRDCLVHALAMLSDGNRARAAMIKAPLEIVLPRLTREAIPGWPRDRARFSRVDARQKTITYLSAHIFEESGIEIPSMIRVTIEEDK
jgi:hypothetical protein